MRVSKEEFVIVDDCNLGNYTIELLLIIIRGGNLTLPFKKQMVCF